jgi:hypothetical protein
MALSSHSPLMWLSACLFVVGLGASAGLCIQFELGFGIEYS